MLPNWSPFSLRGRMPRRQGEPHGSSSWPLQDVTSAWTTASCFGQAGLPNDACLVQGVQLLFPCVHLIGRRQQLFPADVRGAAVPGGLDYPSPAPGHAFPLPTLCIFESRRWRGASIRFLLLCELVLQVSDFACFVSGGFPIKQPSSGAFRVLFVFFNCVSRVWFSTRNASNCQQVLPRMGGGPVPVSRTCSVSCKASRDF